MKKNISVMLVIIIVLSLLSGCSKGKLKDKEADILNEDNIPSTGKYVEEELGFPEGIRTEEYTALAISPDGIPELYVFNNWAYDVYKYMNKTWNKEDPAGLQAFNSIKENFYLTDVIYGEDGRQYLLGDTNNYHNALYRITDQGEYEKLPIPIFDENFEEWDIPMRARLIKVLENGMIAIALQSGGLVIYAEDGRNVVEELNSTRYGKMTAEGNVLYYTGQNGDKLVGINPETKEVVPSRSIGIELSDTGILEINRESAFLCDTDGLHSCQLEGSIWETIVEGDDSSLSKPSHTLSKFLIGTEEDFYIVLKTQQSTAIKHIFFDSKALTVPITELSVFSLEDNKTIRQAVSEFNEAHPEAKISYRVAKPINKYTYTYGVKDPEQTIPDSDYINALNTELLAGRGADILVLDGLSATSYIEKGVLEDMGDILLPMAESGELLLNITENYRSGGKVYTMPVRIRVPVIYGNSAAVNAAGSLKELADYAVSNTEVPLFGPINYRALATWCFLLYYDQIVNEEKEIDEALLQAFLEEIHTISESIKASDQATIGFLNNGIGFSYRGYWVESDMAIYKKLLQANIQVMSEYYDFSPPLTAAAQWDRAYGIINQTYEADTLIGINSAGKHKELAKEFVQLLFSEELQSLTGMGGFPVNTKAMEKWVQQEGSGSTYGDEKDTIRCNYPGVKVRKRIYEELCTLSIPMANDTTLLTMMVDEAERYLRGDITAEQAATNTVGSINTYLSE